MTAAKPTAGPAAGSHAGSHAGRTGQVIVASTRAAAGVYTDRTGPVIDAWLRAHGWLVLDRAVVADGEPVGDALAAAIEAGLDLVITTGGTGVSPTDQTPEQTLPLLGKQLPGIMEELRRRGTATTPLAVLSRGYSGIAGNRTVVINLPGSTGGVQDGLAVLGEILDHLIDQVRGADHTTAPTGTGHPPAPPTDSADPKDPRHGR
ncbi:molybdenum cofactor biosynthesis protein B [Cryobacterium sp. SO1]|uniref:MogA/MoaB family molybdenum cofactor biosynthesis protein n=1 Tax=Cryobacterium sp. SO1 TaxID=1897061 RepID=UPI001022EBB3|nr:MogA/MoaB family molybdenum cofactor biosynthesis protein [Cryobacterium sp. SO1]RZI35080.1 Molybdopterin adenylyltransferase [Cryobacterium sp. SO1]